MRTDRPLVAQTAALFEAILPRLIDVVLVLVLIKTLSPAELGLVERAQATVLPTMLLFLSPEILLLKRFSQWRESGELIARVSALRHFCWLKGLGGLVLAGLFCVKTTGFEGAAFGAYAWAYARCLSPQVVGIDRELQRVSGHVRGAFIAGVVPRALFLAGVLAGWRFWPESRVSALGAAGALSVAVSALLARRRSARLEREFYAPAAGVGAPRGGGAARALAATSALRGVFRETMVRYSLWSHVSYVTATSIESLDVLVIGALGFPNAALGVYGAAVRVANFAMALPSALYTWFAMRLAQLPSDSDARRSRRAPLAPTLAIGAVAAVQLALLVVTGPLIAEVLGPSRWTPADRAVFVAYLVPLSIGVALYALTFAAMTWLKLVCDAKALFGWVFAPWLVAAGALYVTLAEKGDLRGVAQANIGCYAFYFALTALFFAFARPEPVSRSAPASVAAQTQKRP